MTDRNRTYSRYELMQTMLRNVHDTRLYNYTDRDPADPNVCSMLGCGAEMVRLAGGYSWCKRHIKPEEWQPCDPDDIETATVEFFNDLASAALDRPLNYRDVYMFAIERFVPGVLVRNRGA